MAIVQTVIEMFGTPMDLATEEEVKKAKEYVLKRGSATLLLIGADRNRYGGIKNQMQQIMFMGTNNYLKSVDETMNILNTFAKTNKTTLGERTNYKSEGTEVAFAQSRDLSEVTCYHCRKKALCKDLPREGC